MNCILAGELLPIDEFYMLEVNAMKVRDIMKDIIVSVLPYTVVIEPAYRSRRWKICSGH